MSHARRDSLEWRLTRLDDPEMGKVPSHKRRVDRMGQWETVVRGRT